MNSKLPEQPNSPSATNCLKYYTKEPKAVITYQRIISFIRRAEDFLGIDYTIAGGLASFAWANNVPLFFLCPAVELNQSV